MEYKHRIRLCAGTFVLHLVILLKEQSLLDCTNLFSSDDYERNDGIILEDFQKLKRWANYIALFAVSMENLKSLKYHTSWRKH